MKFIIKHHFLKVAITLFLLMIASLDNIIVAEIFRNIYEVIETGETKRLIPLLVLMAIIYGLVSLAEFLFNFFQSRLIEIYNIETRNNLYHSFFKKGDINKHATGEFISLMTNDYKHFETNYLKNIFRIFQMGFYVFFSIIYAFSLDIKMALIFILFSIVSSLVPKIFQKKIQLSSKAWTKNNSNYTNILKENTLGKSTIISYGVEDISREKVKKVNKNMESSLRNMSNWISFSNSSVGYIATVCFLLPEFIGVYMVVTDELSLGILLALMQISNTIVGPFLNILKIYNSMQSTKPIFEKIRKYIRNAYSIQKSPHLKKINGAINTIQFTDAKITYDDNIILEDITLDINLGEKVLIVGESGSGKSSLLNSIIGTAKVVKGNMTINHISRHDLSNKEILQRLSVIQQNVFLFDNTLSENISLGENYSESQLLESIYKAGLDDLVQEKGLYFKIGENGNRLSGGQKQRIEIARALLRNRDLLLIDEATSSLDKEKANAIRSTYLKTPQTIVEIAHYIDPKFLEAYDKIVVLKKGRIMEVGQSSELINNEKTYLNQILLRQNNISLN